MREYRIEIRGKYDILVLSPQILSRLMELLFHSGTRELEIPAEEILPPEYAGYLARVLDVNFEQPPNDTKTSREHQVFDLMADQIRKLRVKDETYPCFDGAKVSYDSQKDASFGLDANENFFLLTKDQNNQFHYTYQDENGEEIRVSLSYR